MIGPAAAVSFHRSEPATKQAQRSGRRIGMPIRKKRRGLAWIVVALLVAAPAGAQEIGLRGQLSWPDGRDLTALRGVVLAGGTGRAGPRIWLETQVGSETQASAALCPSAPPAGICIGGTEPTDLDVRLIGVSLGWAIRLLAPDVWTLDAVPELGGVNVRSERFGQESQETMTNKKTLPRVGFALELGRRLAPTVPVRIVVAGRVTRAFSFGNSDCTDCYRTSFRNGFTAAGAELQVSYLFH